MGFEVNAISPISSVSDALTAAEIYEACKQIAASLGPKADVEAVVSAWAIVPKCTGASVGLHPNGLGQHGGTRIYGDTWQAALAGAREWVAAYVPTRNDALIRRIAVAIIDLSEPGQALTVSALRLRGFTAEEITEHAEAACALATAKCNGALFSVAAG